MSVSFEESLTFILILLLCHLLDMKFSYIMKERDKQKEAFLKAWSNRVVYRNKNNETIGMYLPRPYKPGLFYGLRP